MALNDPKKSKEHESLQPGHGYEDVDLKIGSGNVILLSSLKRATPPELPPRNVGMGGTAVVRPESMKECSSQHCNTKGTQGADHKVDKESEETDQTFEEVNQNHGSQRDSPSEPPSGHLDAGDHMEEETQQERTGREDKQEKPRAGKPATVKWTKAKYFQEAHNVTNHPELGDFYKENNAQVNPTSVCPESKPEVQFWFNNPRMTMSAEESSSQSTVAFSTSALSSALQLQIFSTSPTMLKTPATPLMMIWDEGDSSSVAYSTSAPFSTLQLKNSATSPMMILEEGDSSTVGYATLHILAHGGESSELSTDIGFHAVPPPYPVLIWPSITATCKTGWREYSDNCYKLGETKLSWFKAREECNKHGANLASIQSREENNFLKYFIKKVLRPRPSRSSCQVWIGLRNERGWHWAHGARLTYTNWAPGEPSGKGFWLTAREDCGSMYTMTYREFLRKGTAGMWNNENCRKDKFHYVCEKLKG
ncbi:hypothetical protein Bbelb_261340 [Branchiostoma belcheri]|nr:hypothetical protein Bbelb_261340 [Branchiostoma belcheri]